MRISAVFFLFCVTVLAACSRGKKPVPPKTILNQAPEVFNENGTLLFNGKDLENWEITEFGTQGPVVVSDGKLILNYGDGCTGVTWKNDFPKVNYQVSLEARKTSGNDFFCGLTFPVGEQFCSLIVGGWGGPVVGLSCIDGKDASENETKILKRFDTGQWYKIQLKVTTDSILAWIDNEKMVSFGYAGHELYVRPEVSLSRPFGICTWMTTGEIRDIRLKLLQQ